MMLAEELKYTAELYTFSEEPTAWFGLCCVSHCSVLS